MRWPIVLWGAAVIGAFGLSVAFSAWADSGSVVLSNESGKCDGCQPGEFGVSMKRTVPHGDYVLEENPPCKATYEGKVREFLDALVAAKSPKLAPFAGPVTSIVAKAIEGKAKQEVKGAVAGLLDPIVGQRTASCYALAVKVPKGSSNIRYRWRARGAHGPIPNCGNSDPKACPCDNAANGCSECDPKSGDCSIGWSAFREYKYEEGSGVASAIFANWSHDREREAELIVYFTPPKGWRP